MFWKFELPLLSRAEIFAKINKRLVEVIWKSELPLLSRAEIFSKIKQFCLSVLKIWTAPIITNWNFLKNEVVLLKCFEIWTAPIITGWNFLKNEAFCWSVWKFELPLSSRAKLCQNMADFMKSLENSGCPYYRELKFSQKWSGFVEVIWKFDLALYHKLAFLQK